MSEEAILRTTRALQRRLEGVVGTGEVAIGPPLNPTRDKKVSIFLFHVGVNASLRNERFLRPPTLDSASSPAESRDALPLDLRYLVTVFRQSPETDTTADPGELVTLGKIIRVLHAQPNLSGEILDGQVVRLTPEPYPMEELSRIWGMFQPDAFRTSVVYLATPVYIETDPKPGGPPVDERTLRGGTGSPVSMGGTT